MTTRGEGPFFDAILVLRDLPCRPTYCRYEVDLRLESILAIRAHKQMIFQRSNSALRDGHHGVPLQRLCQNMVHRLLFSLCGYSEHHARYFSAKPHQNPAQSYGDVRPNSTVKFGLTPSVTVSNEARSPAVY